MEVITMANNNETNAVATVGNNLYELIGVNLDATKVSTARAALKAEGAQSYNLSPETAAAAYRMTLALRKSDSAIKDACKIAGVFRLNETWKSECDDAGKPFKSENAFLRAILPGYALSTVSVYADVGATVYVPALMGKYPDMPYIGDLTPGNAKFLLAALKDTEKRKRLPAVLNEQAEATKGKLTQRGIQAAVKSLSDDTSSGTPGGDQHDAGRIVDELSGGAVSTAVKSLLSFAYNGDGNKDGDLTALVMETKVKDFISLLLKATNDKDTAVAVCSELYALAKAAK